MRRRGLWWVAAATALLVLGGCGSDSTANVGADSGAQRISDSDSPRDYFSRRPRCKPGVALYSEVADLGGDSPGGPTEPEEALAAHLAQYYSGRLNVQSFTRAADSSKAADPEQRAAVFTYDDPDAGELMLFAQYHGDSWYVTGTQACADLQKKDGKA